MIRIIASLIIATCLSTSLAAQERPLTPLRTTAKFFQQKKPVRKFVASRPVRRAWFARPGVIFLHRSR